MANTKQRDSFDAILADHKNSCHYFEELDGTRRIWRELYPEAKLGYVARDAVCDGVSFARLAEAVRDVLGELPEAAREEAALRLVLESERQSHQLAALLPPDDRLESVPQVERFQEVLASYVERVEMADRLTAPSSPPLSESGTAVDHNARERLVDTLFSDFFVLEQQAHLAGKEVSRAALASDISRVEHQVVKLANALFAAGGQGAIQAAGYESPFQKDQPSVLREDQGIKR